MSSLLKKFEEIMFAKDEQGIELQYISALELKELHKSIHKNPFRYYFEENSSVLSPWISYSSGKRLSSFIGAYSYINDGGYLRDRVLIGRFCSIGRRTTIAAAAHSMTGISTSAHIKGSVSKNRKYSREEERFIIHTKPRKDFTVIESDCWIGDAAVIMPGLTLRVGTVVGANSVLTIDTEPYGVYAGSPAKLIKKRFSEDIIERLLTTSWWEYPLSDINKYSTNNVFDFLEQIEQESSLKTADYITYSTFG